MSSISSRRRRQLTSFLLLLLLSVTTIITSEARSPSGCPPSSCGNIRDITYPFRLTTDHRSCGHPSYELDCQNNQAILTLDSKPYYVESLSYNNFSIWVVDPGLARDNCSSLPVNNFHGLNRLYNGVYNRRYGAYTVVTELNRGVVFFNCRKPINSTRYVDDSSCGDGINTTLSSSTFGKYAYVAFADEMRVRELEDTCVIRTLGWGSNNRTLINNNSFSDIHDWLAYGFELKWDPQFHGIPFTFIKDFEFLFQLIKTLWHLILLFIGVILGARFLLGVVFLLAFLGYNMKMRHLSMYDTIEDFLQSKNHLTPMRYTYSEIRSITNHFKDKLGEGGYGTVYKGKLRSGLLVAVKIMGKSKATGQDFINEVATIGRIHHVNVVRLMGFCSENSKRALIYEFMPNRSLEKYIFPEEGKCSLSSEKIYEISMGVARGIDYLHRGCAIQILHFDIKPHNILLDENFNPKISDFGLAKLSETDDSVVNLTAARGTLGYMAPELFYRNIGGVSYKADVYSFGMLLMEMAGRRKNFKEYADHSSQIFFPTWVYDQFKEGMDIEVGQDTEEEREMVKKMIIVALWCIQMKPSERPSMSKVVEMLEGHSELLQMPPKPFLYLEEVRSEPPVLNNYSVVSVPSEDFITEGR